MIQLDYREKALIEIFQKNDVSYETKNLLIGDINIKKDGNESIIIERKTLSDLLSSIKDGR